MRNFRRAVVLMMFFCLASSWSILALDQKPVELVAWEKLADFIIEISGWIKKGDLEGSQIVMGNVTVSQVLQHFVSENGKGSLEIHIMDTAESLLVLAPFQMMMRANIRTSQEYIEKITINDFPGIKTYNYSKKEAGLLLLILNRFLFQMHGHNFTEKQASELVAIAKKHDIKGIVKLVK